MLTFSLIKDLRSKRQLLFYSRHAITLVSKPFFLAHTPAQFTKFPWELVTWCAQPGCPFSITIEVSAFCQLDWSVRCHGLMADLLCYMRALSERFAFRMIWRESIPALCCEGRVTKNSRPRRTGSKLTGRVRHRHSRGGGGGWEKFLKVCTKEDSLLGKVHNNNEISHRSQRCNLIKRKKWRLASYLLRLVWIAACARG